MSSDSEVSDNEVEQAKASTQNAEGVKKRPPTLKDLPPKTQAKVKAKYAKARLEGEAGVRNKMKILKQMELDEKHIKLDDAITVRAERIAELKRLKEEEREKATNEERTLLKDIAKQIPPTSKHPIQTPDEEDVEIEYRKVRKVKDSTKPKPKKIVYIEETTSEDDSTSEEEVVVKKRLKSKPKAKPKHKEETHDTDSNLVKDEILKREVKHKVDKMRDEVLKSYMNSFFPRM